VDSLRDLLRKSLRSLGGQAPRDPQTMQQAASFAPFRLRPHWGLSGSPRARQLPEHDRGGATHGNAVRNHQNREAQELEHA
jgi:hypothetical protein